MSAIKKGMINWANVKTGKKQQRENDGTGFSLHLEATIWNGRQTGARRPLKGAPAPQRPSRCCARTNPWGAACLGVLSACRFA